MATKPNKPMRKQRGGSVLGIDWEQEARAKIQASGIVNRLISFVNGEISLQKSQVSASLGLLKKVLPDLSSSENKTTVTHRYVARLPAKAANVTEWQQQYAPTITH